MAVRTYVEGLSLRRVANVLEGLGFRASHEAVRQWFHATGELLSAKVKHRRGFIAADETVIWNLARKAYLWAARKVRTGDVLAIQVSNGSGLEKCLRFTEVIRDLCANALTIYTNRSPWYDWPMKLPKLRRKRKTFGRSNSM